MAQQKHQLKMVYHQRMDGTLCLLKTGKQSFGFSDETLLASFLLILGGIKGLLPLVRIEEVMVDDRFPFIIDPDRVHISAAIAEAREMLK